jgi:hypothetical protein
MLNRPALILLPLLLLAACSAPREVVEIPRPLPAPEVEGHPSYETFDPSEYDAEPRIAPTVPQVEHDVPTGLMEGRIVVERDDPSQPVVVEGFRIQLFSSQSKVSADGVRDEVVDWWRTARERFAEGEVFPYGLRPAVVFTSPYYRVRLGAFPTRADASLALEVLRERYPEAFIVPDTITLSRE